MSYFKKKIYIVKNNFIDPFIKFIFPSKCYSCSTVFYREDVFCTSRVDNILKFLAHDNRNEIYKNVLKPYLCNKCLNKLNTQEKRICTKCGTRFKSTETTDHLCGKCLTSSGKVYRARSVFEYELPVSELVSGLKYNRKTLLAKPLGFLLFLKFLEIYKNTSEIDMVIPVPLHKKRLIFRGFNQSELLVNGWNRYKNGVSSLDKIQFKVARNVLKRIVYTKPQVGSNLYQRRKNLKNAFRVYKNVKGKTILLIDDVYTTGTTLEECASILLKKGAKRVDALTFLRVSHTGQ